MVGLFLLFGLGITAQELKKPYVILVSLDGFRWDYPNYFETPNLDKMAKNGVKAKSMQPSYPTKTFPNHYSIATGLYPDHHGIVNNNFYDPTTQKSFTLKTNPRKTASSMEGILFGISPKNKGLKRPVFIGQVQTQESKAQVYSKNTTNRLVTKTELIP